MTGTASTAGARAVARLVGGVRIEEIEGMGHMAPVNDPGEINARGERFLANNQGGTWAREEWRLSPTA